MKSYLKFFLWLCLTFRFNVCFKAALYGTNDHYDFLKYLMLILRTVEYFVFSCSIKLVKIKKIFEELFFYSDFFQVLHQKQSIMKTNMLKKSEKGNLNSVF